MSSKPETTSRHHAPPHVDEEATRRRAGALAMIVHELRNPLDCIMDSAALLQANEAIPKRFHRQLEMIRQAGAQQLMLINDLLALAAIEAREFRLHPRWFSLRAFAEDLVEQTRPLARRKNLPLRLDAEVPALLVLVDDVRLRQVLLNLLVNAIRFTDAGHVTLGVTCREDRLQRRVAIEFVVTDTGRGVASPQQPQDWFDLFSRCQHVEKTAGDSGIGLFACKELASRIGGHLAVVSHLCAGSRFTLTLPMCPSRVGDDTLSATAPRQRDGSEHAQHSRRLTDHIRADDNLTRQYSPPATHSPR